MPGFIDSTGINDFQFIRRAPDHTNFGFVAMPQADNPRSKG